MRVVLYYDLLRFSPCSIDLFISEHISPPTIYVYSPLYEDFYTIILSYTSPHRLGACWQKVPYLRARVESIFILALVNTASVLLYWAFGSFSVCWKSTKSFRYYNWLGFRFLFGNEKAPSHFAIITGSAFGSFSLLKMRQVIFPVLTVWESASICLY